MLMGTTELALLIAVISLAGFALTLVRHILFKRELLKLKEDMEGHAVAHGIDDALWDMFITRTVHMLRFWR